MRPGSSNSLCSLRNETPEKGERWWVWNSGYGLWEQLTVVSVNQRALGVVEFARPGGPSQLGRLSTMREGWGYRRVSASELDPVSLGTVDRHWQQEELAW